MAKFKLINRDTMFGKDFKSSGAYSTEGGKLMSGTKEGYGEFGQVNTEIGRYNPKTGKQELKPGYSSTNSPFYIAPKSSTSSYSKKTPTESVSGRQEDPLTRRQKRLLKKGKGYKASKIGARIEARNKRKEERAARRAARKKY